MSQTFEPRQKLSGPCDQQINQVACLLSFASALVSDTATAETIYLLVRLVREGQQTKQGLPYCV